MCRNPKWDSPPPSEFPGLSSYLPFFSLFPLRDANLLFLSPLFLFLPGFSFSSHPLFSLSLSPLDLPLRLLGSIHLVERRADHLRDLTLLRYIVVGDSREVPQGSSL